MQELVARLSALDAEAGAALKVITYFDKLNEGRVGLETLVRGAAVLSGFPAGLSDPERHLNLRVLPDKSIVATRDAVDPEWLTISLLDEGAGIVWLETTQARAIDELILERLVVCVRSVLDRTRRRVVKDDAAALEVLLSPKVSDAVRLESARRLGWSPTSRVRALAVVPEADVKSAAEIGGVCAILEPAVPGTPADRPLGRIGVGRSMPVLQAWQSWEQARVALRFTSAGTPEDPGPRTVRYSEVGATVAALAGTFGPGSPVPEDVQRVERAAETTPWLLETLYHVVMHSSLRAASAAAHLHHSTLQDRVAQAELLLGWPICEPYGRFRLQFALIVHKLCQAA
jgi:hypothetical protein